MPSARPTTMIVCHRVYLALQSLDARVPLWSAEHLTDEALGSAEKIGRVTKFFHPEATLPYGQREELADPVWIAATLRPAWTPPIKRPRRRPSLLPMSFPKPRPIAIWKAVYDPVHEQGGAWLCRNDDAPVCETLSFAALKQRTGIDPFPSLSVQSHNADPVLPRPEISPYTPRSRSSGEERRALIDPILRGFYRRF